MRSRLISANSSRKMLLNPRFGSRRCSGIWPPSKPLMRTPERAVWPLPPRPACLPLPEPMPRPTRMRPLMAPSLSLISFSFMMPSSARVRWGILDAHEVFDLLDHAAHRRGVGQGRGAADFVQPEPDEGLALLGLAADRRADLLDRDGAALVRLCHHRLLTPPRRRHRRHRPRHDGGSAGPRP